MMHATHFIINLIDRYDQEVTFLTNDPPLLSSNISNFLFEGGKHIILLSSEIKLAPGTATTTIRFQIKYQNLDKTLILELISRQCLPGEYNNIISGQCELCPSGYYSINTDTPCAQCPLGARCYGGNNIFLNQGYWRAPILV